MELFSQLKAAVSGQAPKLLGAVLLFGLALLVAVIASGIVRGVIARTALDKRYRQERSGQSISSMFGDITYWVTLLLFMPPIFQALGLQTVFEPIQAMLARLLGFVPNLVASVMILVVGGFLVRMLRHIVVNLIATLGSRVPVFARIERIVGAEQLAAAAGTLVYAAGYVPVLLASLHALNIEPITRPVSDMLGKMVNAVPNLFAACLLMTVAYLVGTVAGELAASLAAGAGLDTLPGKLGLAPLGWKPSQAAGRLAVATIVVTASMEAARMLGFEALAVIVAGLIQFSGDILLGVVILAAGLYLANLAALAVRATSTGASAVTMANAARVATLVFAAAIALRRMGLANEIVNMAFGLVLGGIAVAFAIAFGLGGREAASQVIADVRKRTAPQPAAAASPSPTVTIEQPHPVTQTGAKANPLPALATRAW